MNKAAFFIGAALGVGGIGGKTALHSSLSHRTNRYGTGLTLKRPMYDGTIQSREQAEDYYQIWRTLSEEVETLMRERLALAKGDRKRSWATYERIFPEEVKALASERSRLCSESDCMFSLIDKVTEGLTLGLNERDVAKRAFDAWVKGSKDTWVYTGRGGLSILERPMVQDFKQAQSEALDLHIAWEDAGGILY